MTKIFDKNSRVLLASRMILESLDYDGTSVSEMVIRKTTVGFAREYISTYHYTHTMPDSTMFCFAGWFGAILAGIVVFGMGSGKSQYTSLIPCIQNGEYLELTRLWSPDGMPKNTESRLIMGAISLLPKEIKLIISYADPSRHHVGTVYQATNFHYCGMSAGGKVLVADDGIEKHPRLLGVYRMRHPEYQLLSNSEIMGIHGWQYGVSSPKHRYAMVRGNRRERKRLFSIIAPFVREYPKRPEAPE